MSSLGSLHGKGKLKPTVLHPFWKTLGTRMSWWLPTLPPADRQPPVLWHSQAGQARICRPETLRCMGTWRGISSVLRLFSHILLIIDYSRTLKLGWKEVSCDSNSQCGIKPVTGVNQVPIIFPCWVGKHGRCYQAGHFEETASSWLCRPP